LFEQVDVSSLQSDEQERLPPAEKPSEMHVSPARSGPSHCSEPSMSLLPHNEHFDVSKVLQPTPHCRMPPV